MVQNMDLLKTVKKTLAEASEDLFPGLDASVFDEHNKYHNTKRTQLEELNRIEEIIDRLEALTKNTNREVRRIQTMMRQSDLMLAVWRTNPNLVKYKDVNGLEQAHPNVYKEFQESYGFDPTSPKFNDLPNILTMLEKALIRKITFTNKTKAAKAKASRLRRVSAEKHIKDKKTSVDTTIPESQIFKSKIIQYYDPRENPVTKVKTWVATSHTQENPYYEFVKNSHQTEKYAGHPANFKWKGRELTQYFMLVNLVKSLGLPELDILYLQRRTVYSNSKEILLYYLGNSDESFHCFSGRFRKTIYTKETRNFIGGKTIERGNITAVKQKVASLEAAKKRSQSQSKSP